MVTKNNITPLGTPDDDGSFSDIQSGFGECYASLMDSSFAALGRNIILHLQPQKIIDTSGVQASTPAVHYNPFMRRGGRQVPSTISTTRTPAVQLIHRDVTYIAKIKHGPKKADDKGGLELLDDEVMTTLVIAAQPHVNVAISATIDGRRYSSAEYVHPFGFQTNRYILVKWKRINESEN